MGPAPRDLAGRLADARLAERELASHRRSGLRFSPDLLGGVGVSGYLDDVIGETVLTALIDAAPEPTTEPVVDAGGRTVPRSWARPDGLEHRLALGLHDLALAHLDRAGPATDDADQPGDAGAGDDVLASTARVMARRPGTTAHVVVDLATLLDAGGGLDTATSRLLWRLAGGRRTLSRARASFLSCDSARVPVLTDGDRVLAVGDAHDPIPTAVRRAAAVRDQGCRFPGCDRPQAVTDLHHVVFRSRGGATTLANLVSLCRHCHDLAHADGWQLHLDDYGVLTVRRGTHRFHSRPRLRPPTPPPRPAQPEVPTRARAPSSSV